MKRFKKTALLLITLLFISSSFVGCANAKLRTHAGVEVNWGPHGPKVRPHMGVEVYNGGRH